MATTNTKKTATSKNSSKTATSTKVTKADVAAMKAERKQKAAEKRKTIRVLKTTKSDLVMQIAELAQTVSDGDELIAAITPIREQISVIEKKLAEFTIRTKRFALPGGWIASSDEKTATIGAAHSAGKINGKIDMTNLSYALTWMGADGSQTIIASGVTIDAKSCIQMANANMKTFSRSLKRIYGDNPVIG